MIFLYAAHNDKFCITGRIIVIHQAVYESNSDCRMKQAVKYGRVNLLIQRLMHLPAATLTFLCFVF